MSAVARHNNLSLSVESEAFSDIMAYF